MPVSVASRQITFFKGALNAEEKKQNPEKWACLDESRFRVVSEKRSFSPFLCR